MRRKSPAQSDLASREGSAGKWDSETHRHWPCHTGFRRTPGPSPDVLQVGVASERLELEVPIDEVVLLQAAKTFANLTGADRAHAVHGLEVTL